MEYVPCNLCNVEDYIDFLELEDKKGTCFKLVKCNSCGLIFMNPRPVGDEKIDYYPNNYSASFQNGSKQKQQSRIKRLLLTNFYKYNHLNQNVRRPSALKILESIIVFPFYIKQILTGKDIIIPYLGEGKILDVGCGASTFLYKLRQLGWKTYGIELNEKVANFAKEKLGSKIFHGDFDNIILKENFFDVVNMCNVLEHLAHPLNSLKKVNMILKPSGMVIIRVPNVESYEARICKEKWTFFDPPHHLYHFSSKTIKAILNRAGFEIKKIKYDFHDLTGLSGCLEKLSIERRLIDQYKIIRKVLKFFNFWFARLHKSGIMVIFATKVD